ncbi:IucA/IucC family protein [Nonomuraea gerenzanensis]|uniref:Siderophore staphylobactin biosynthesis protein SbnC @ Siderophore synthetase superfamily, group B n=1 Tax=Nonomuraea gerenzanensis TaxID=93944 RepID=A0A1M4EPB9_9ACTN|nr:IucA/IucC family protein [Nonomuraea gerenzanensis]UBU12180.1 siderophore biosynthesis protein [Nonomuraea gerenzanensis]SBP00701.1 Siderophore staphylobactin biosynthesis protein SbnC @ Siderophore synthetase superfamily, group B [Nonomuraea gerenzanensis]
MSSREAYLAARVLDALLREDYGGLASRVTRTKDGVGMLLADGRWVRLSPGVLFQDFVVAADERLGLEQVLETIVEVAAPEDAEGVAAFFEECVAALAALELHDERGGVPRAPSYETLAASVDHPVYPTSRARVGLSESELLAYAPEFGPSFELRWAVVPRRALAPGSAARLPAGLVPDWPGHADEALLSAPDHPDEVLFPVHPLTVDEVRKIDGVRVLDEAAVTVRPTLSMRTVEVFPRLHLKLPLPISTLGARNRRSIKAGTLADGARAELLLRELAGPGVVLADEQTWAHAGHEHLAWMVRRLPEGEIVPVAALGAPGVLEELGDVLPGYLRLLLRWNVRLFVRYGVALEAHQQNLALLFRGDGLELLVKDNDGLLASPSRLRAAGVAVPEFADERMLNDDPHALADVFVTITLHLACAAVVFGALPHDRAAALLRDTLAEALDEYGDDPMARLLRARTLDAARLTGKSMITAGTLVSKRRSGARDVNKFYGTSGPNYLRRA